MSDDFVLELQSLADRLIAFRLVKWLDKRAEMDRLAEKWAKAGGVVGRVEKQIEDKLDALIARETTIGKKTDDVFARTNAPIDDADKALDALDSKLNLLSNGGPDGPLPGSGDSQDAPKPPPAIQQPEAPKPAPVATVEPPHVDQHPAPSASNWVPPR